MNKSTTAYFAEFIGTMILILIGCGSAVLAGSSIGTLGISLTFGMTLIMLAYILGPISGCHLNPAITISFGALGKLEKDHVLPYIIAQLLGAVAGAYILLTIAKGVHGFDLSHGFATNKVPHGDHGFLAAGVAEVIFTGLLVLAALMTTTKNIPAGFTPILMGTALFVFNVVAIPVTNASINFARSFGPAVVVGGEALHQLAYFGGFTLLAAILGSVLFKSVLCQK